MTTSDRHRKDETAHSGLPPGGDEVPNILAWRKAERQRLIDDRRLLPFAEREEYAQSIAASLDQVVADVCGKRISLFWPFQAEPDLRGWMATLTARGADCLLPVVIAKAKPLIFRSWKMGERLERGAWNIPVPADGKEAIPDVVVAPLVGFDPGCYRLGYGGGFFDRTLAAFRRKPLVIGVGFESQGIETIHPLAHDIPMDVIVTETGSRYR